MKNKPLVSVIVPCYNQGKYVFETLKSVQKQTFRNFECVIVNDGSSDDSQNVIEIFCQSDSRFRFFYKKNEGVSIARNYAIKHSRGEYILPLDADDVLSPDYLQESLEVFSNNPNIKLVYTETRLFGRINSTLKLPDYNFELLLSRNLIVCTALYKRVDYDKTKGYNPNMSSGLEDWDFWLSFLTPKDIVYKINKELFFYRIKKDSRNVSGETDITNQRKQIWYNHRDLYSSYFFNPKESVEYILLINSIEYRLGKIIISPIKKAIRCYDRFINYIKHNRFIFHLYNC